jgi:DNA modification methylase
VNVKGRSRSKRQDEIAAAAGEASSGRRMAGFNERWEDQGGSRRNSFARSGKLAKGDHGQKPQFREDRDPVSYVGDGRNLRNYEPAPLEVWRIATKPFRDAHFATFPPDLAERCIKAGCPVGGLVLDPFGGAGTTGLVAEHLQRDCDMIELNPEYARLAVERLRRDFGLLGSVEIVE